MYKNYHHQSSRKGLELVFDTSKGAGLDVSFYLRGTVNVDIDWGCVGAGVTAVGLKSFTYGSTGTYTVKVTVSLTEFGNGAGTPSAYNDKLTSVLSFGNLGITNLSGAFRAASNLETVPATLPLGVKNLSYMFRQASKFNGDISKWDTSQVTSTFQMFSGASLFNSDISSWNTGSVTAMGSMFQFTDAFNQPIGKWNIAKVQTIDNMFYGTKAFDQDISEWKTGGITYMGSMFYNAVKFNQDISVWNTGAVTDMGYMFYGAKAFNQDISKWDISNVTSCSDFLTSLSVLTCANTPDFTGTYATCKNNCKV